MTPWQQHVKNWEHCQECPLCTQRQNVVLARGTVPCDVLLIGEAPGISEDALGKPFIGPAGKLIDQVVERAIPRDERADCLGAPDPYLLSWAFTNLVACFPAEAKETSNHQPNVSEIEACRPRLDEFIMVCQPRLIVTVGGLAEDHLSVEIINDKPYYGGMVPVCRIVHPAHILRMPLAQRDMATRRAIATLSTAIESLLGKETAT